MLSPVSKAARRACQPGEVAGNYQTGCECLQQAECTIPVPAESTKHLKLPFVKDCSCAGPLRCKQRQAELDVWKTAQLTADTSVSDKRCLKLQLAAQPVCPAQPLEWLICWKGCPVLSPSVFGKSSLRVSVLASNLLCSRCCTLSTVLSRTHSLSLAVLAGRR